MELNKQYSSNAPQQQRLRDTLHNFVKFKFTIYGVFVLYKSTNPFRYFPGYYFFPRPLSLSHSLAVVFLQLLCMFISISSFCFLLDC